MHILRVFWLIFFLSGWAFADELYIYPAKGQSQDQEEKDKFQCYQFGKKQTGFDPMKAPTATSQELDDAGATGVAIRKHLFQRRGLMESNTVRKPASGIGENARAQLADTLERVLGDAEIRRPIHIS